MILFVSLDGFYTRGLVAKHPEWSGRPLVVSWQKKVLDASAEAVARQVVRGMALSEAKAILQDDGRYSAMVPAEYEADRREWLDVGLDFTETIEPESPASAYFDLDGHPDPELVGTWLMGRIQAKTGLTVNGGMAPSKWVSKLASRPIDLSAAGLGIPCIEAVADSKSFLAPLPTRLLTPVEPQLRERLVFLGYRRLGHVAEASLNVLAQQFGRQGLLIYEAVRGKRLETIKAVYPEPSLSRSFRFEGSCDNFHEIEEALRRLSSDLACDLSSRDMCASEASLVVEGQEGMRLRGDKPLVKARNTATHLYQALHSIWLGLAAKTDVEALRVRLTGLKPLPRIQTTLDSKLAYQDRGVSAELAFSRAKCLYGPGVMMKAGEIVAPRRERLLRIWRETTGWVSA